MSTRRNIRGALAGCVVALYASGCPLSKPPTPKELLDGALPDGTVVRPSWAAGAAPGAVVDRWLLSFRDARLDALVAEAIAHNLDLRQAAAKVEIARDGVALVGAQLKPQIGVRLGADATRDLGKGTNFEATKGLAGVSWEIDVWGRLRAQRAAAVASYQATALDYAYARQSLAATVATGWYQAIELRELVRVAADSVAIYEKVQDLVRIRSSAGKTADLDLAEIGATLAGARSELEAARGLYSKSLRNLELLLGRYPSGELETAPELVAVPSPIGAGVPSALLERRPDVLAAERETLVAFRLTESAKLARWPQFAITLDVGRVSDGLLSLLHLNPWFARGAVGMDLPVYTGGALTAKIGIATARQQVALAHYGAVILQAFAEVEDGLMEETVLAKQLEQEQASLVDRVEAVRIGAIQYDAGKIDLLPLLQLQSYQLTTRSAVIKLRYSQLANRVALHLALGGSFDAAPARTARKL